MLQITEPAAQHLRSELSAPPGQHGGAFRVMARENCLEVVPDEERPGDVTLSDDKGVLLVIDPATAGHLADRTIEYDQAISRLVFS